MNTNKESWKTKMYTSKTSVSKKSFKEDLIGNTYPYCKYPFKNNRKTVRTSAYSGTSGIILKPIRVQLGNCKNYRSSVISQAIFKIDHTRDGLENDSGTNQTFRIYIVKKGPLASELSLFDDTDTLTPEDREHLNKELKVIYTGINNLLKRANEDQNNKPTRVQLFINDEDPFYSIVFGFKLSSATKITIGDFRFRLGIFLNQHDIPFLYAAGNGCHVNACNVDLLHINDGPNETYTRKQCIGLFDELAEDREIETAVEKVVRRGVVTKKAKKASVKNKSVISNVTPDNNDTNSVKSEEPSSEGVSAVNSNITPDLDNNYEPEPSVDERQTAVEPPKSRAKSKTSRRSSPSKSETEGLNA